MSDQICAYDDCFAEFLKPAANGQKHVQSILLQESFRRFQDQRVGIQPMSPTTVLDVSCGPGEFSVAWTSAISTFMPAGMEYCCTDFPGGICKDTSEKYPIATARKIREAAAKGLVKLTKDPAAVEANLFSGEEAIISPGKTAHIVHWSHSGYHVRDSLGDLRDDAQAIEQGLNTAIDKIWAALDANGLLFTVHQTDDLSDGIPSEMFPVSTKYLGALANVPTLIAKRVSALGGYTATVNFATPLKFPDLSGETWDGLKSPAHWDEMDSNQSKALRLLSFVVHDFTDSAKSGLAKLSDQGTLGGFINEYAQMVKNNGSHIFVKCAFQMICKNAELATKLSVIAHELREDMPSYLKEMSRRMQVAERAM